MSTVKTGGSAFPRTQSTDYLGASMARIESAGGMTLRDYFAAKALLGSLCSDALGYEFTGTNSERAQMAYGLADAMLAERSKGGAL